MTRCYVDQGPEGFRPRSGPAPNKLRDRAVRIVMSVGELHRADALDLLEACDGDVAEATRRARRMLEAGGLGPRS